MLDLYRRQKVRTSWGGTHSTFFDAQNGIRQGSIASPVLFCTYLDSLIEKLRKRGVGCWVGPHFFGALVYADDVAILCPTLSGLQKMVKECELFAEDRDLTFNSQKSVCMKFTKKQKDVVARIRLSGSELKWEKNVKYLGNFISCNLGEEMEVNRKRGDLFGRTNSLLGNAAGISPDIKAKLFNSQCCHLYGVEAWSLADRSIPLMFTAANRCLRRIFDLPYRTHSRYLPIFAQCRPIEDQLFRRSSKLICKMQSVNPSITFLTKKSINDCSSIISSNLRCIDSYEGMVASDEDRAVVQAIKELRSSPPEFLQPDEVDDFVFLLCTI